ncbi:GDSL-type esterase/lipase family protein [Lentisphaera profundi]|uniref:GDSL-type esterase/lipase family protein n=1 Tax=Lentisphaera profundi TaxID=1658616 RepID=A0ABY7VNN9_9BACT|nr:GDSL-type esterase/lipase family protein [Lentisphaera profundi]WDE95750.1 GDSL-type esterase/lipase family protein [Lentisphaera profundi]
MSLIKRGFGGSTMKDVLYYTKEIVLAYKPRAILIYEGDNDISFGRKPDLIKKQMKQFCEKVWQSLPHCRIYVLSIKPSLSRESLWPKMVETNILFKTLCESDEKMTYIDVASTMINEDGSTKKDLFIEDGLHMKRQGYELWRVTVRNALMKNELKYEASSLKP